MSVSLFIFFTCIIFCFESCVKGGKCEEAPNLNNSAIQVNFKDNATGKYLYAQDNPVYNIDSIKVYDESNQRMSVLTQLQLIPNTVNGYWSVNFGNIYNPQTDVFNSDICRNFIVKYTYNEVDTIKACFKAKKTDCGSIFEYLNVFYKGDLVGNVTDETGINLVINKK